MTSTTCRTTPTTAHNTTPVLCDHVPAPVVLDAYFTPSPGATRHTPLVGVVLRAPVVYGRRPNGQGMSAMIASAAAVARAAAQDVLNDIEAWFVVVTSPDRVLQHNTASLSAAANTLPLQISTTQVRFPHASTLHMPKARAALLPLPLRDLVIRAAVQGADIEMPAYSVAWRGGPDA